jgi:FkbM family methyltransferase
MSTMSILTRLFQAVPPGLLRYGTRLRNNYAFIRHTTDWAVHRVKTGEVVIRHGVGTGLKFDCAGGHAGYALGTTDLDEQKLLAELLLPGMTFFDIGANVGFFSTLGAAMVGSGGHVYAFEPFPDNAAATKANAERNGFDHVTVIQSAVSNRCGLEELVLTGNLVDFKLKSSLNHQDQGDKKVTVKVVTIDGLLRDGTVRPPDVIMIDVEGSEIDVLEGMKQLIIDRRPTIICEVHWLGPRFLQAVDWMVRDLGYVISPLGSTEIPREVVRWHAIMKPA